MKHPVQNGEEQVKSDIRKGEEQVKGHIRVAFSLSWGVVGDVVPTVKILLVSNQNKSRFTFTGK